ncbi:MAG: EamA family transporter [Thermaerobacter sp.]|nr:EamA family transporter [Thermaerobacter sp.]
MKHAVYLELVGFSIVTGVAFNLARYAVGYFSPAAAAAWRFGIAGAIILGLLARREGLHIHAWRANGLGYLVLGVVGVFGFNTFFFLGMKSTSAVNGALIMASNPVLTTLLAWAILRDRVRRFQVVGIMLALTGVVMVITGASWQVVGHLALAPGDGLVMAGNLCWALYGVLGRRVLRGSSPLATTAYTMAVGAAALMARAVIIGRFAGVAEIPPAAWGSVLFMAVFTSVLGYQWWNHGMATIGASNTAVFFNLVPVVTMAFALMTGQALTLPQGIGAILVISGVLVTTRALSTQRWSVSPAD